MQPTYLTNEDPRYPEQLRLRSVGGVSEPLAVLGEPELLRLPLTALLCSRRCPGALILQAHELAQRWRETGTPVVSGFQSPVERECLRVLLRGTGPLVMCLARKLLTQVPPELREAIEAGRLALVTPFVDGPRRPDARMTAHRNRLVAALAERVVVIHASPGGMVERLCGEAVNWGVPVVAPDHPGNEHLTALGVDLANPDQLRGGA